MAGVARERRRWTSTLATAIPAGPEGQPQHDVGAEASVIDLVEVPGTGSVSITVPRPSLLLLGQAEHHMRTAERLREAAKKQIRRDKWVQPAFELSFTNERLVFDFFEHAMAGIVLAHTALDNVLNELLPADFVFLADDSTSWDRQRIESSMGIERRITQVAAAATGRPNLRSDKPELFAQAMTLKRMQDDLGHAKRDRAYGGPDLNRTIFSDLFDADLVGLGATVSAIGDHYEWG